MNNKPVAWMNINVDVFNGKPTLSFDKDEFAEITTPLYTHSAINNGGNLEELNTKVQDASTSLESTPPINTEPVGRYYWESVVDGHFMAVPSEGTIHYEIDDFPLYLHPAKELTDEEIMEVCVSHWINPELWDDDDIDFARAILRKAQEK